MKSEYIENLIIKSICNDQQFLVTISNVFKKEYFENKIAADIFSFLKNYVSKYESLPQKDIIINSVKDSESYLTEIEAIDVDLARNYDFIFDKTNEYLKDRALKKAILDSVDIINKGNKKEDGKILKYIEDALTKDLKIDLGLNYFESNKDRLKRVLNNDIKRIPSYFPILDEIITGGFTPYTLSVFTARIHGFKCVDYKTYITIKEHDVMKNIMIGDLYENYYNNGESVSFQKIENNSLSGEYKACDESLSVYTDIGWVPINYLIKTTPLKKFYVKFKSGIEIYCADKHAFIIDNEYNTRFACDLRIGDEVISENNIDTISDIIDMNEQTEMYDVNLKYHNKYYTNSILSHNSAMISNLAARQVLNGHNVVIITLELSEDSVAQRIDSIYSGLDINKLYNVKDVTLSLVKKLNELNNSGKMGKLLIKEFPTGEASVFDIKRYIRELKMRNFHPDIIYVDYINLMRSTLKSDNDLYGKVKKIAEELRAMSFTFNIPVVSVSQLNREGSNIINLKEIDFTHISECISPDSLVERYENGKYVYVKLSNIKVHDYIRSEDGPVEVLKIFPTRIKRKYKIKTKSGKEIICSPDHIFPTTDGFNSINKGLKVGDKLFTKDGIGK